MNIFNTTIKVLSVKTIILVTLMLLTQFGQAQGNNPNTVILGTWTVDRAASLAGISAEDNAMLNESPELRTNIQQGLYNRTFSFNQDGTFGQVDGHGNQMNGAWELQGQTLTIRSSSGKVWIQQIVQLNQNLLALQQAPKGEALPIVPILYLTKN